MTPSMEITTINPPNTDTLPKHDFSVMLAYRVTTDAEMDIARTFAQDAQAFIDSAKSEFYGTDAKPGPVKLADKAHKALTTLFKRLTDPAESASKHCRTQISNYLVAKEAARRQLEERLQREAQAKADAEAKQKAIAEAAALPPWEQAAAPAPAPVVAPKITVAQEAAPEGIQVRNKPWSYEIEDFHKLVCAVAADKSLLSILLINDTLAKAEAKTMQQNLGSKYPGLRGTRGTTIALT